MSLVIATARGRLGGVRVVDPEDPGPPEAEDTGGLNTASALDDDLLWCVVSGDFPRRDRVGAYDGQPEGAAALTSDAGGSPALHSPAWSGTGWFWPTTGISLGTAYTLALRLAIDPPTVEDLEFKEDDFPKLLAIPYRAEASWLVPFGWHLTLLPLTAGATSVQARLIVPLSATQRNRATSPAGFVLLDGAEHTYAVRVQSNGDVDWSRDGSPVATTAWQDFTHAAPDLGDAPHLIAFAEHRLLLEEGLRGTMPATAIWGKALSDQQIADFHTNPWNLVEMSADPEVPATLHAWDDFVTLVAGETSAVSVLANDSGTGRFVDAVTQPGGVHAGTSVAIVDAGAGIEVTIDEAETAEAFDFTYTAKAPGDQESTATVHVEVFTPPPLGADDAYTRAAGQTHTVSPLANDNAPEGSTIIDVTQPAGVQAGTSVAIAANELDLEITIDAAEEGSFEFTYTADGPGVAPWTQDVTVTVAEEGETLDALPYRGRLYGGVAMYGPGDIRLNRSSQNAVWVFFRAERTGWVKGFWYHRRIGVQNDQTVFLSNVTGGDGSVVSANFRVDTGAESYASGDGGTYTVELRHANGSTRFPDHNQPVITQITGYRPTMIIRRDGFGTGDLNWGWPRFMWPTVFFPTPGFVEAGEPYCLIFRRTSSSGHVAINFNNIFRDMDNDQGNPPTTPPPVLNDGNPRNAWTPYQVDGVDQYPWPIGGDQTFLRHRRIGLWCGAIGYTDGPSGTNIDSWHGDGQPNGLVRENINPGIRYLTGNSQLRERFRVTRASRVVDGVYLHVMRKGSQTGNVVFTLESGPSSDTSGNGTVIEQVSIAINTAATNVGSGFSPTTDKLAWYFFPFSQNRTLQLGQLYNARLRASSSGAFGIGCGNRGEHSNIQKSPRGDVGWDTYIAQRTQPLTAWEDSRGAMETSNGGSSWSFWGGLNRVCLPILFRCVI